MATVVVDTNLILIANGQHSHVGRSCIDACSARLREVMAHGRIAIDDGFRILEEYQHKTHRDSKNQVGDEFVEWALRNHDNPARCDQVPLEEDEGRGFVSFPNDIRLQSFDPSDRKFVAVAAAHPDRPTILQASDSKWLTWASALSDHEIEVEFVCPSDIARFHAHKLRE